MHDGLIVRISGLFNTGGSSVHLAGIQASPLKLGVHLHQSSIWVFSKELSNAASFRTKVEMNVNVIVF